MFARCWIWRPKSQNWLLSLLIPPSLVWSISPVSWDMIYLPTTNPNEHNVLNMHIHVYPDTDANRAEPRQDGARGSPFLAPIRLASVILQPVIYAIIQTVHHILIQELKVSPWIALEPHTCCMQRGWSCACCRLLPAAKPSASGTDCEHDKHRDDATTKDGQVNSAGGTAQLPRASGVRLHHGTPTWQH